MLQSFQGPDGPQDSSILYSGDTLLRDAPARGQPVHRSLVLNTGERVSIQRLGPQWIDRMIALQKTDGSGHTITRDRNFFEALFDRGDTAFGIVAGGNRLIGQATVRLNMDLLPDALRSQFNAAAGSHAYLGSIVVDPDYQGHGLMGHLVHHCAREAAVKGSTDMHSRVLAGNDKCLQNFTAKFNFAVVLTGQSPDAVEPRRVHFLHKKL